MKRTAVRAGIIGTAALALLTCAAAAQQPERLGPPGPEAERESPAGPPIPAAPQLTRADVEAWLDGLMPYALQRGDIAGAVVVVVQDGAVLVEKGYGYADVERREPVDPKRTLFRPGSVSKLFTWTAAMQLVEQGKLDLDRDVNEYLDFEIPPAFGKPITLRHLMTHTAGFEEVVKNLFVDDTTPVVPLETFLKSWTPKRIFPPGQVPAYSNYGTALAGYMVERVSGESFDDYVERHIFRPLGMERSTFRQPLPDRLEADMAKGYGLGSESDSPKPYEMVAGAPAGSLAATGDDMGRFMIAHLQHGRLGDTAILKPETTKLMHGTALTIIPPLNRMVLGFYESNRNGRRAIAHAGDTYWFHSDLHLFVDDGVGLFVSMNSAGKDGAAGAIRSALFEQFADRYFPRETAEGQVDSTTAAEHARLIAGVYENSRRSESNFFNVLGLIGAPTVVANDDGTISASFLEGLNGQPKKWRETSPFVWREVDGENWLAAKVDRGKVVMFSGDELSPFMMFQPVPWWKSPGWLPGLLLAAAIALVLTAATWPVAALVRRHYRAPFPLAGRDAAAHRRMRVAAMATVIIILGWAGLFQAMLADVSFLTSKVDPWVVLLRVLTFVVFVGAAIVALWHAAVVWRSKRSWWAKAWSVVLAVACVTLLWVGLAFKLIGFGNDF